MALAAEGASVVVNYSSSKEAADKVVKEITAKGGKFRHRQTVASAVRFTTDELAELAMKISQAGDSALEPAEHGVADAGDDFPNSFEDFHDLFYRRSVRRRESHSR